VNRAVLATLGLLPTALGAQGGAVFGAVHDTLGRPIRAARVEVSGSGLATTTDDAGRYRLKRVPSGQITLRGRAIGYQTDSTTAFVVAGDSVRVELTLRVAATRLSPIVVTAAKRQQSLEDAVASVALVSDTQIAARAVNTIDEAVDRAPGVQFLNGQVNIRGSTGYVQGLGSRVLVLVDGVPANQGDRGGINWDLLPVDNVERVEVVKGAGSALYGSAAFGGVVNLITRDIPDAVHARLRVTGGAFAGPPHEVWRFRDYTGVQGGVDVTASWGGDPFRGSLSAGTRHSDGYRQQDLSDHWQMAGKGTYRLDPVTQLEVTGAWASDQYQVPLTWCIRGQCDDRGQAYQPFLVDTSGLGDRTRSDKGYVTAVVSREASPTLSWLARGSWLRTDFHDYLRGGGDFGVADRFGGEVRGVFHPDPSRAVTVGAEVGLSTVTSDIFGNHSQAEYAAYGEGEHRLRGARLTTGARIDFLAVDGGGLTAVVSPRVGVVLPAGAGVWRGSVGRGFRAPSMAERFVSTVVYGGLRVVPNPNLRPEEAWTAEVGHARRWTAAGIRLDAAAFWTEASQLIEPDVNTSLVQIQFQNLARARLVGLDIAVAATPLTPRLATTLAYMYLSARELAHDTTPARPLAFRPRHLLTLGADYTLGDLSFGADFRYTSRFERVELYESDPRVAAKVLDLRAAWRSGPLAAHLLVANALNYIYNFAPRTLEPVRTVTVAVTWSY
jgi:outer membrane receptor for ferrienterochelin and colicins